jgi:hypothetical protein
MMQGKQTIASCLAGLGWALLTFLYVLGRFWTFLDVLKHDAIKPIYCITIFKQLSTCSKDDAIIPRGLAGLD